MRNSIMSAATRLPSDPDFEFNPMSPEYDRDPYPILAVLREHAPVYEIPGFQALFLTRHADVVEVLADESRFSGDRTLWENWIPPAPEAASHPVISMQSSNLLAAEGAAHTRLRKLASAALTRRAVKHLDPLMHALADELIDRFIERGEADFTREFAEIFPVNIVSRLMGIPRDSDRERRFKGLADSAVVAFNPMCSEEEKLRSIHSIGMHMEEIRGLMEEKRAHPGNDLMTDMVQAVDDAERSFTEDEILGTLMAIIVAGSETTANSLSFGLIELLRHPEQLALFRDDPSCRPNATAEIVRHQHPGRFLPRFAKEDTQIAGTPVRKGQMLFCSVPAANRDPAVIDDPDRFDITRIPFDLSAFGVGRHFCIGAQLARLELEIALGHVVERLSNLELQGDFDSIRYRANPAVRGPASLPIRFTPGRRAEHHGASS
jgi:cytochrome P450